MIQPHVNEAVARERRLELRRAAGCCSPVRGHRRAAGRIARCRMPLARVNPMLPAPARRGVSSAVTAVEIRSHASTDAGAIADIHNQGIAERAATFDPEDVTPEDVTAWLGGDREPVLVAELDGRVVAGRA